MGLALVAVLAVLGAASLVIAGADRRLPGRGGGSGPPGQVGVAWDRGLLSADGERLAVAFVGRRQGGDQTCGAWYVGLSAALRGALRVTVITIPGPGPSGAPGADATCPTDDRSPRCAEVRLPYPPGGQPIVDAMTGRVPPMRQATEPTGTGGLCSLLVGG
jgi:hypothetical protein